MATSVITITDGSLVLADTEVGLASGDGFECQVTSAAINAVPNLETVPATFCSAESQSPAATGWTLAVAWLQDWRSPAGGLSGYTFTNDTLEKWFELKLDKDDITAIATGQVRIVAGAYGGAAGTPLPAEAEWPLAAKPDIPLPAAMMTRERRRGRRGDRRGAGGVTASAAIGLRDQAGKLAALPRTTMIAAARAVKDVARAEGGTVPIGAGRWYSGGRTPRPARLRARDEIQVSGSTVHCWIQGLPVGPWVWVTSGARPHLIGVGRSRRRAHSKAGYLSSSGYAHPVLGPIAHPGRPGGGRWRTVQARAAEIVPQIFRQAVAEAVR